VVSVKVADVMGAVDVTQKGSSKRPVDVTAPCEHVMSLHVPGSHADTQIEQDCRDGIEADGSWTSPIAGVADRFVRGSGTSQSPAVVSGAVARVLSKNAVAPAKDQLTPELVRRKLMTEVRPLCWLHARTSDGRDELNLSNDNDCVRADSKTRKTARDRLKGTTFR
jgi:serine protease AprX